VRAAAGLQVDAGNAQQPDASAAAGRLHAHGLDEIGPRIEFVVADPDGLGIDAAADQCVHLALDALRVEQAHVDVEVETGTIGSDVAAGDRRDDDARHQVQRRVETHQPMAARPVDLQIDPLGIEQAHVDVEVETSAIGSDVAASDGCNDDAGHQVQRAVQAHQPMATRPVDRQHEHFS
jgi:hypothetical protein